MVGARRGTPRAGSSRSSPTAPAAQPGPAARFSARRAPSGGRRAEILRTRRTYHVDGPHRWELPWRRASTSTPKTTGARGEGLIAATPAGGGRCTLSGSSCTRRGIRAWSRISDTWGSSVRAQTDPAFHLVVGVDRFSLRGMGRPAGARRPGAVGPGPAGREPGAREADGPRERDRGRGRDRSSSTATTSSSRAASRRPARRSRPRDVVGVCVDARRRGRGPSGESSGLRRERTPPRTCRARTSSVSRTRPIGSRPCGPACRSRTGAPSSTGCSRRARGRSAPGWPSTRRRAWSTGRVRRARRVSVRRSRSATSSRRPSWWSGTTALCSEHPPELPQAARAALEAARTRAERFRGAVAGSPDVLRRYVAALNELPARFVWWWAVANPELEHLWTS